MFRYLCILCWRWFRMGYMNRRFRHHCLLLKISFVGHVLTEMMHPQTLIHSMYLFFGYITAEVRAKKERDISVNHFQTKSTPLPPPQLPPVIQDGGNWDFQCAMAGYLAVALLAAPLMAGLVKGLFGLSQSLICTLHNYAGFTVLSNCNSN